MTIFLKRKCKPKQESENSHFRGWAKNGQSVQLGGRGFVLSLVRNKETDINLREFAG